jgi:membrane dipeptidase
MTHSDVTAFAAARALLDRLPLFDGHNDLPWVMRARGGNTFRRFDPSVEQPRNDTDLPRLKAGGVAAQVFAAFLHGKIAHPATVTLEQIDVILRMEDAYAEWLMPVRSAQDLDRAWAAKRIGSIISVEGTVGLEGSLAPLRLWHRLGVRLVTLCHNETLPWVDSATDAPSAEHDGLSKFGAEVIAEMNRLGLIIDLAHVAPHAMHKVLDVSTAPVFLSHGNAAALCPHPRNVPDDVLRRVAETGSLAMVTFVPEFLNPHSWRAVRSFKDQYGKNRADTSKSELTTARAAVLNGWEKDGPAFVADHLDYFVRHVGEDHVGIGSDFYGGPNPPGLEDCSKFPNLVAELQRRQWSERRLEKVLGGNFRRVWTEIEARAGG